MDGTSGKDGRESSPMWRDQRCLSFISAAEAEMYNFISPVEGAGWKTIAWQGICCCKVAGALQHFTKSAHTPDSTIDTFPPTIYKSMNKIKIGKAPGVCSIYPEYTQHSGSDALCTLHKIVTRVCEEKVVPEE